MSKKPTPPAAADNRARALLDRYRCPVPFHAVRTRFLGNIASPDMTASPIKMVQALWGGELPAFETIDAANELIGALVMGLWTRISCMQTGNALRISAKPSRNRVASFLAAHSSQMPTTIICLKRMNIHADGMRVLT